MVTSNPPYEADRHPRHIARSTELAALNDALPGLDWLRITDRKSGAIQLTALDAQPEPRNLRRLKKAVRELWGQVPLIDMVTEAALRTGMLGELTAVGSREALQRSVQARRAWPC